MDVLFVDVGFGTCNVILTGSGEAVVLDAGERTEEPVAALHHFTVARVRHLVVSHWHDDHVGGATGILRAYTDKIGKIWFPPDPAFKKTEFWKALVEEYEAGKFKDEQIVPLLVKRNAPTKIWSSASQDADLSLVSPSYMEAGKGGAEGDSNATCGVLVLRAGERYIVFAGDATLAQWEKVPDRIATPIQADVLAVPHHAGIMWPQHWNAHQIDAALDKLYSKLIKPQVAIVSASTRPGKKHPREDVLAALGRAEATRMCTQMTQRCTSDLEAVRALRATSLPAGLPGRSSEKVMKPRGKSVNVACAGSVLVELLPSGVTILQLAPHQAFVDKLPNTPGALPICRR